MSTKVGWKPRRRRKVGAGQDEQRDVRRNPQPGDTRGAPTFRGKDEYWTTYGYQQPDPSQSGYWMEQGTVPRSQMPQDQVPQFGQPDPWEEERLQIYNPNPAPRWLPQNMGDAIQEPGDVEPYYPPRAQPGEVAQPGRGGPNQGWPDMGGGQDTPDQLWDMEQSREVKGAGSMPTFPPHEIMGAGAQATTAGGSYLNDTDLMGQYAQPAPYQAGPVGQSPDMVDTDVGRSPYNETRKWRGGDIIESPTRRIVPWTRQPNNYQQRSDIPGQEIRPADTGSSMPGWDIRRSARDSGPLQTSAPSMGMGGERGMGAGGQYTVGLTGGGSVTVNASSPEAAVDNANQQTGGGANGQVVSGGYASNNTVQQGPGGSPTVSGGGGGGGATDPNAQYHEKTTEYDKSYLAILKAQLDAQIQQENDRHEEAMMNAHTAQEQEQENARHNAAQEDLDRRQQDLAVQMNALDNQTRIDVERMADANRVQIEMMQEGNKVLMEQGQEAFQDWQNRQKSYMSILGSALNNPWLQQLSGMTPPGQEAGVMGGGNIQALLQKILAPYDYSKVFGGKPASAQDALSAGGQGGPGGATSGTAGSPDWSTWQSWSPWQKAAYRTNIEAIGPGAWQQQQADLQNQFTAQGGSPDVTQLAAQSANPATQIGQQMTAEAFGETPQQWSTQQARQWSQAQAPQVKQQLSTGVTAQAPSSSTPEQQFGI